MRGSERSRVAAHLAECDTCSQQIAELASVRSTLRDLPEPVAPAPLRTELLVIASRERRLTDSSRLQRVWNGWRVRLNEMMRPLTIPATGGVLSSLVLFAALAVTISTTTRAVAYEVPVLYADKLDPNLVPVELRSSVVLTLTLDGNGRITDYAVRDGSDSFVGDPSRLQYNNIGSACEPRYQHLVHAAGIPALSLIDHRRGCGFEVSPENFFNPDGDVSFRQGARHQAQPSIARGVSDGKRSMPHAQAGMATFFDVVCRAAEAKNQKVTEALFGSCQVAAAIERAENFVLRHLTVETSD
jgi:hypothetical protein